MTTQHPLLLIDDDQRLADMVSEYLSQSGYAVDCALEGAAGLSALHRNQFDLVILDLMLPDMDGLDICRHIRTQPGQAAKMPVLILTAKGDPMDRVIGLELGADDYLTKPFEPRELLARVRTLLRRHGNDEMSAAAALPLMRFGSLEIDRGARRVTLHGQWITLTSYQFDMLVMMAENAGRVLTREQLTRMVRGRHLDAFDRSVDVQIGRIRAAIEVDAKDPKRILTVRGMGYVFVKHQA